MWSRRSGQGTIGIDITSTAVRAIELKRTASGYRVLGQAEQPLPAQAVVERRVQNATAVVASIRAALGQGSFTSRHACVAVPSNAAITRVLPMPASLHEDEVEARIPLEVGDDFPFPFHDVAFDFQRLPTTTADDEQQSILLVACRRQYVELLSDIVTRADLHPCRVDLETLAMGRVLSAFHAGDGDQAAGVALLDVGAESSALHVFQNERSLYSRDLPVGGQRLIDDVCSRYRVTRDEAVSAMRCGNLPSAYEREVLVPFVETLGQQVGHSLQLFGTTGQQEDVGELILAGSGSLIPGLQERLTAHGRLKVAAADPFGALAVAGADVNQGVMATAPAWVTACGLAMRSER
ncbi:type IV pilus assembly protein PilM [Aidingimonas halophila]|uniref:Type IV pilus assembly protein PilM n=1 Tax=Aidingimonas halophila TaxID=574349 RepID=A0A1H2VDW2_9GAMM|nr:type IV pilus assembly protein PilM [Aidingimonas halophila]GHC24165.1 pilus assembly protein PilM [Aidingimonas halophila]SDW66482.1 type IV pilus assembly protein PilM [Aidingimonas halophila]